MRHPPAGRAAPRALARRERIGILNLNMAAMGGGEKRTLVMAEHLRRRAEVFSVCDPAGPVGQKDPLILHVGRFMSEVAGGHHKRQEILLEAFRGISSLRASGWRLAFAGHLDPDPEASAFLERLRAAARGLPVDFHVGSDLDALRDLYRRAAIYWHATGFGSSERRFPERQEHFGITTVEAMSAGAVPIVMDSGGQRETVRTASTAFAGAGSRTSRSGHSESPRGRRSGGAWP